MMGLPDPVEEQAVHGLTAVIAAADVTALALGVDVNLFVTALVTIVTLAGLFHRYASVIDAAVGRAERRLAAWTDN